MIEKVKLWKNPYDSAKRQYNIGDLIEIINFGSLVYGHVENNPGRWYCEDRNPEMIGNRYIIQEYGDGWVRDIDDAQIDQYKLIDPKTGKGYAWYSNLQMKLIKKNEAYNYEE